MLSAQHFMHKRFVLSSSNAESVLESNTEKYQFEQNFILDYPTGYKNRPSKKEPSHFENKMRLTKSSNSVKINCHTKFRDNFLIFKGLGINNDFPKNLCVFEDADAALKSFLIAMEV